MAINNNQDVTDQCQVGIVSEDGSVFRMLTPVGGVISADLPSGPYQCTVMYVSESGAVSIAQVAASIKAGAVTRRTATIDGKSMPGLSQLASKKVTEMTSMAATVEAKPDDALAVCNLGAVLHLLERLEDSVEVMRRQQRDCIIAH